MKPERHDLERGQRASHRECRRARHQLFRGRRGKKGRLHLQIFRALVATGLASLLLTGLAAWLFRSDEHQMPRFVQDFGAFVVADMPEGDRVEFARELQRRSDQLHASITVWDRQGEQVARAGKKLGPQHLAEHDSPVFEHEHIRIRLDDGRTLAISFAGQGPSYRAGVLFCAVALLLATLMVGSYLAARRITRRLERLEHGVTQFGQGRLDVRVDVRGRDEIASLAGAFNRSFDRIAGLLKQQTSMLQSASHELRSPLARLRMAMELATEPSVTPEQREELRADAGRDIEELDALIGDLLLAGRLADTELPKDFVPVELRSIVQREAARVSASCVLTDLTVLGNARMLSSLIRNLLENARRHGRDPIRATLSQDGPQAVLRVEDGGDGVPEADRERIFEPFYRPVGHREGKDGGVGLGLSLVKNIAEHLGGSVRYLPDEPGSCFEVRLPRA
ncbi:MAG: putative sensory histidine kinase in two-component regulatory system [Myxococcaceae bacterium]|nr:putative sensory histidine kinase in two-component regulatory system [Myxococcaceae bacterium]